VVGVCTSINQSINVFVEKRFFKDIFERLAAFLLCTVAIDIGSMPRLSRAACGLRLDNETIRIAVGLRLWSGSLCTLHVLWEHGRRQR